MIIPDALLKLMTPAERKRLGKAGVTSAEANAKAAHKSEKEMQEQIQAFCDLRGWPVYRSRMDKRSTGRVGTPDFLICVPSFNPVTRTTNGVFMGIECKMPGNKPSPEQAAELTKIESAGGAAMLAHSAKSAIDALKEIAGEATTPTK